MNEFETSHNKGCFITLTYSEENLPADNGLHKEDLQKFFKRLRKRLGDHKIKYFACGEYGDHNKRPHYHAIIFNLSVMDASILLPEVWTFGFFKILPVFYESCKYVTGYVMKKYNGDKAKEEYGDKEVPFRLSSLGLGKSYALEHRQQILANLGVQQGGHNKGFPKYYQSLFEKDDYLDMANRFTETEENFSEMVEKWKNESWKSQIKKSAIESSDEEKEAYRQWLKQNKPDDIVEISDKLSFESWRRSVNKLRDLTIKAKCSLHESKRRGKDL